jgi:16S rRNA processing protein RimM
VQLVVGRIAKAHGINGEVSVEVRTDDPDTRFAVGATLETEPAERGPLRIDATRWHAGRLLVRFVGVADRTAAEGLRSTMLVVDSATSEPPADADEYWDHDLVGLAAFLVDGTSLGEVTDVLHPPGPDLLVIRRGDGAELLVPFVAEMVPTVDLAAGRIAVDPPEGLFEL